MGFCPLDWRISDGWETRYSPKKLHRSVRRARNLVAAWRDAFNHHRRLSRLAGLTPWGYTNRSQEGQNLNGASS